MSALKKKVFLGTFVHSKNRQELEYLHDAAIFVDDKGKIVKIDREQNSKEHIEKLLKDLKWDSNEVEIIAIKPGQFFFPGFIGKSSP